MTQAQIEIVLNLLRQFGDNVPLRKIAEYAQDEFMIPFETAVKILYDAA